MLARDMTFRRLLAISLLILAGCGPITRVATMELSGTSWQLVELDGEAALADALPMLAFDDQGAVTGSTGCNTFNGQMTIDGSDVAFGPLVTTRKACLDPAANRQEQAFLAAMEGVTSYTIDEEGRLVLQGVTDLTFEVAPVSS
jgi:heat shock protein HslJ